MSDLRKPFKARPIHRRPNNVLQFEFRPSPRTRRGKAGWWTRNWAYATLAAAPILGVGAAWAWNAAPARHLLLAEREAAEQFDVSLARCSGPIRTTCVVDGDTFWLEGTKIRIADINTPEVGEPKCPSEAELGERATERLIVLLNDGGFSLRPIDRDEDRYGRKLRIVTRGGTSLGDILVDEGLAERWTGSRRNWC